MSDSEQQQNNAEGGGGGNQAQDYIKLKVVGQVRDLY